MTRADAFSRDMCTALREKCGLDWQCGKPQKGNRECVDVVGKKESKDRVLIEVELRRGAPLQNVVKIWRQLSRGALPKDVVLFQAFSSVYDKNGTRRQMAAFIGREMTKAYPRMRYIQLSMDYSPRKRLSGQAVIRGGGRRKQHAVKLARRIVARLRKMRTA